MPNKKDNTPANSNGQDAPEEQGRLVAVNAQYVKDLSFESPGAPASLVSVKEPPKIDVSVDVQVSNLEKSVYEVTLIVGAKAAVGDKSLFLTELSYGGVFTVDVPEEEREPVLMIYCPGMLFPFARRIIADTTRDGGFPPLMLDPIDFSVLYQQHKNAAKKTK